MGKTSIEWTDASWNPIVGCTEVSPGCANCYAARLAATRLSGVPAYKDLAILNRVHKEGKIHPMPRWLGNVAFLPERLEEPLGWRKPRRIFVCDMGDLFHENVKIEWIANIFNIMASATVDCGNRHKHTEECWTGPSHTYQVLTKRPERMLRIVKDELLEYASDRMPGDSALSLALEVGWPLPNVWLGVSVENQHFAVERIPALLSTPAAVRFISAEPLLGPVDLLQADPRSHALCGYYNSETKKDRPVGLLNWVIAGGESGPHARPMHPEWARSLRDQCQAGSVPFFFKQWGEFAPIGFAGHLHAEASRTFAGVNMGDQMMLRYGKKLSGRLLDGREWNEFPEAKT
jgi:protein gp37